MAKIKVLGSALTITSDAKFEDIKRVNQLAPEYAKTFKKNKDDKFEVDFAIATTEKNGSCTNAGIIFDSTNAEGNAYITLGPVERTNNDEEKDAIAEHYMPIVVKLNDVEAHIAEGIELINSKINTVKENVDILD